MTISKIDPEERATLNTLLRWLAADPSNGTKNAHTILRAALDAATVTEAVAVNPAQPKYGDAELCAICKQPIVWNGQMWEHRDTSPRNIATPPTNPNAETVQPFPHGRFASKDKRGV